MEEMKNIVIIANFCSDLSDLNNNNRFVYLCNELSKNNNVELITSDFRHGKKTHRQGNTMDTPYKITCIHELGYKKNVSIQRFFSHKLWGKAVGKYIESIEKPDIIYCAVPSLTAPLVAAKYCKKNNIKFIIDIQDLWPEAFKMILNLSFINKLIFYPFQHKANKIYSCADEIIAVSEQYVARALAVNKKVTRGHCVYIGTKLQKYDDGVAGNPVIFKPRNEIWIGYCGSLAISYDIPNLIFAMDILHKKGINNIKLIIMGDGGYKQIFEDLAREKQVNAHFTGKLPYNQMAAQLNQCDIVVNPIKRGSAASIINKHADYAASGRPVINSQENKEYRKLIEKYHMGLNCNNEDAVDMADKLEYLIKNYDVRIEMGKNARRCAEENFDRQYSYQKIIDLLNV